MKEQLMEGVHSVFDGLGLIPGAGEVFDGTNAVIYASRGKTFEASLSLGAMIPFIGWSATGGKLAKKVPYIYKANEALVKAVKAAKGKLSFSEGVLESFTKHAFAGNRHADLGLSVEIMASKGLNLIKQNMSLLKAGDNVLIGNINGIQKSFKAFVKDGKIMSVNMYPGVSNRVTQGTVINFGNVTW